MEFQFRFSQSLLGDCLAGQLRNGAHIGPKLPRCAYIAPKLLHCAFIAPILRPQCIELT